VNKVLKKINRDTISLQ